MLFSPASKDKAPKNDVQRNVLTDTNTRQLGIDGLSASVQRMRREITELSNSLGKYMESQEAQQKNRNLELDKELASIKKDIREIRFSLRIQTLSLDRIFEEPNKTTSSAVRMPIAPEQETKKNRKRRVTANAAFPPERVQPAYDQIAE